MRSLHKVLVLAGGLAVLASCGRFDGNGKDPEPAGGDDGDDGTGGDDDTGTNSDADDRTVGGIALCAGGGVASSGAHTAIHCISPVEVTLPTTASDGSHTLYAGPIRRVSP